MKNIQNSIIIFLLAAYGCGHHGHGHEHGGDEKTENTVGIKMTTEEAKIAGVVTGKVIELKLKVRRTIPGEAIITPGNTAKMKAPASGFWISDVILRAGSPVKSGAIVGYVIPVESGWNSRSAKIEASIEWERYQAAQKRLKRLQQLHKKGLEPLEGVIVAENDVKSSLSKLNLAAGKVKKSTGSANGELLKTNGYALRSPISGRTKAAAIIQGSWVNQGDTIVEVIDSTSLCIKSRLFESDKSVLGRKPSGLFITSEVKRPIGLDLYAQRPLEMGVAITCFSVENKDSSIKPGQKGHLSLVAGETTLRLAVPSSALIEDSGAVYVFIKINEDTFARRIIKAGITDGKNVEIIDGLTKGDEIVIKNAAQLEFAAASAKPAATHVH
ncbi:hypothetical protein KKF34_18895 [Myxococcota bacterium]|nr:hypothetical protein [Myxococcota bacterium]MBU1379577.1 hypothetical protein [Myxococcota bacterium]MBU1498955.1 hypothetical protein [Myxococcota bacterium]